MLRLLQGLWVAMKISIVSILISMPLGILVGALMTVKNRFVKAIFRVYLEFIRIMPQLVLLFIVYFGSTRALGWNLSGEVASVIVFVLWGTAEMGDLVRGALISIPKHQYESSEALGFSKIQTYLYIIIPQTVRRLIPLSINLITRMIKTTSLVLMIGVVEMLKVAQQIIEANRMSSPNAAFGVFLVEYVLISTWCMAITDVKEVEKWLERKDIGHADFYVGEIFQGSYADVYLYLKKVAERFGSRVCIFRNHAKVMAGFGNAFDFVIESSANVNTNPRTEQTCITIDTGLARFYKEFYDEINNFTKDFDNWKPYTLKRDRANDEVI